MLFHSAQFGLFLLAVLALSSLLSGNRRARHLMLLAASALFYAAWNMRYLGLILFSTLVDYVIGGAIHRSTDQRRRRVLLGASITVNLGVLGLFKYYGFFVENLAALLDTVGLHTSLPMLHLLLPVGISFYTFQSMSYTIDIYRGRLEPRRSFIEFALFVSFFPQLVAGPIVRASQFLPQLDRWPGPDERRTSSGLYLVLKGLAKKVVIADLLGRLLVDPVFAAPAGHGFIWGLLAIYAFKFQIYNDFSGYSDIAVGCGRLLGYELPINFRSPYKAQSIREYWQRWHITLGSWFRDYLFYPLGGTRLGEARTQVNLLLVMGLVGLWHGAQWTFILWGLYYGVLMCLARIRRRLFGPGPASPSAMGVVARVLLVFNLTAGAALLFRAPDLQAVRDLVAAPLTMAGPRWGVDVLPLLLLAALLHFAPERWKEGAERIFVAMPPLLQGAVAALVIGLLASVSGAAAPYYYFQF